jgi:hypothetical protein
VCGIKGKYTTKYQRIINHQVVMMMMMLQIEHKIPKNYKPSSRDDDDDVADRTGIKYVFYFREK